MTTQCECLTWAREGGSNPSDHHPRCPEYKLETFAEMEHDGAKCIVELREVAGIIGDEDCAYTVRRVRMTRDQFNRLPEFEGF